MNSDLLNNIKKYVKYDNYIREEEKKLKNIKKKRDEYSEKILNNIIKNKLSDNDIRVGNSKITCKESKNLTTLNQKFIKENIRNYFKEHYTKMSDVDQEKISNDIFEYILNSRKITKKLSLKRIFN